MPSIAFMNIKGGVGRTQLCVNIGSALARMNKRVLLIDAHQYAGLTSFCFSGSAGFKYSLTDLLLENAVPSQTLQQWTDGGQLPLPISVIPAEKPSQAWKRASRPAEESLQRLIGRLESQFDYILIDGPSSVDMCMVPVLNASNLVLIVYDLKPTSFFCLERTRALPEFFGLETRPDFKVVANMFSNTYPWCAEMLEKVKMDGFEIIGKPVWQSALFDWLHENHQSIFAYGRRKKKDGSSGAWLSDTAKRAGNAIEEIADALVDSFDEHKLTTDAAKTIQVNVQVNINVIYPVPASL